MKLSKVLWIAVFPASLWAQEGTLSVTSPAWQGVQVHFVTKVEPPGGGASRLPGGVVPAPDRAHRVIVDLAHKRYFGYDLRLEPLGDGRTMRLRIEPLSLPRQQAEDFAIDAGWTLLAPAKYSVVPAVHVGETVALDLLVNPATGQKIVDYLTLRRSGFEGAVASRTPHDFDVADLELRLDHPRVSVNGKLVESTAQFPGGITGGVVWFYLAGHGRFVISLFPETGLGFQKSGVVAANALTFRDGASDYRVECGGQIAPGSGLYNIYVLHDSPWRPRGANADAQFLIGGAGKAEWLIGNR